MDQHEHRAVVGRHSLRKGGPESKKYPGITVPGVEEARGLARSNVLDLIETSPAGSVIFIAGVSDEVRTRSTADVYGNTLKRELESRTNIVFLGRRQIQTWKKKIERIGQITKKEANKKVVIHFPLFIKELSSSRAGTVLEKSSYFKKLKELHGDNQHALVRHWITSDGELDDLEGPKPQTIADNYQRAINRLQNRLSLLFPGRPIVVYLLGHSWELDVAIAAFANKGKVNLDSFDKVTEGGIIRENESARIIFQLGRVTVQYRNKTFTTSQ